MSGGRHVPVGSRRTGQTIKAIMSAISVGSGSTKIRSRWIMSWDVGGEDLTSLIIYDQHTGTVIHSRVQAVLRPSDIADALTLINGKLCRVCGATYIHKQKCPNKINHPLEGENLTKSVPVTADEKYIKADYTDSIGFFYRNLKT